MRDDADQSVLARLLYDIAAAFLLLTRVPVPWHKISSEPPELGRSVWAYPIVGLFVGAIGALTYTLAWSLGLSPLIASLAGLSATILLTGAFHEDGLADVADGFGGGITRDRKLEIMRDSRIGTYGTLALCLSLGFRVASLSTFSAQDAAAAFILSAALSRMMITFTLAILPPARKDSLATDAGKPEMERLIGAGLFGALCLGLFVQWQTALVLCLVLGLILFGFSRLAKHQVGGHTGDVLGAMQQLAEIGILIFLAAVWSGQ